MPYFGLDSQAAVQLMNCWGITVKYVWAVPRATNSVYAHWLSGPLSCFWEDVLARRVKFYQSLLTRPSPELTVIARVIARDQRSTTGANNRFIYNTTGLEARTATLQEVRRELRAKEGAMTDKEEAVALKLTSLLEDRAMMEQHDMETRLISLQFSQLFLTL